MVSGDGRFVIVFNGEIYNHAELRPQLSVVVNFPVENYDEASIARDHGLVPGGREIHDRQAPVAQTHHIVGPAASVVRAPAPQAVHTG